MLAKVSAVQLNAAFRQKQASPVYLCPLDLADDLPAMGFGPNRTRRFTTVQLQAVVNSARLKRINSNWAFQAGRFSEFEWLVVEETQALDRDPGDALLPFFRCRLT